MITAPQLVIRHALALEADKLTAIAIRGKLRWGYSASQVDAWRSHLKVSAESIREQPTYVAELEQRPIGFYALAMGVKVWDLVHLWVDAPYASAGYDRVLLGHALRVAADAGIEAIGVDADPQAESFYRACGGFCTGSVAAPTADQPNRVRPQFVFLCGGL